MNDRPPVPVERERPSPLRVIGWLFTHLVRWTLIVVVIVMNLRLHSGAGAGYRPGAVGGDAPAQLAFLRDALDAGAGERMQERYPEGHFFTHVLFGLSSIHLASTGAEGPAMRERRIGDARFALEAIRSETGKAPFAERAVHEGAYGIFYWGWRTWLEGQLLQLVGVDDDPELRQSFVDDAEFVSRHFQRGATPFPQSYEGQAWPSDAVVAIAALSLHDELLRPRYARLRERWIEDAMELVDPETQLLPHRVYPTTGATADGSRASSQAIIQRFLPWVDEELAREQYPRYRELFFTDRLGIPAVREYPEGVEGQGDVDSGPLFWGVSFSSTVVSLGPAQLHRDRSFVVRVIDMGELFGLPITFGGKKRYLFGLLPVSDAFFLWSKLGYLAGPPGFVEASPEEAFEPIGSESFRLTVHAISALVVAPLVLLPYIRRRRRKKKEQELGAI